MRRKPVSKMVLGAGPVFVMAALFAALLLFLGYLFWLLRGEEPGLALLCLLFALASGLVAVLLVLAYAAHRREDRATAAHWAELEQNPTLGDPTDRRP